MKTFLTFFSLFSSFRTVMNIAIICCILFSLSIGGAADRRRASSCTPLGDRSLDVVNTLGSGHVALRFDVCARAGRSVATSKSDERLGSLRVALPDVAQLLHTVGSNWRTSATSQLRASSSSSSSSSSSGWTPSPNAMVERWFPLVDLAEGGSSTGQILLRFSSQLARPFHFETGDER